MNIAIERLPDCKAVLNAEVPAEIVKETRDLVVGLFSQQAKVPGYRPGKTPRAVVEKRYAKQIDEELKERLFNRVFREAGETRDLEVLGIAKIDREVYNADGTFSMTTEVVTAPEVSLPDYKGIAVEIPKFAVDDERVAESLERMRSEHAEYVELEGRELAAGDVAVISWEAATLKDTGPEDGPDEENGGWLLEPREEYWIKLPAADAEDEPFLPGFAKQLAGLEAGETKDVEVTFDDSEAVFAGLRGKTAVFPVTVKSVREEKLPELTDELASKIAGGKTLEDLRAGIRANLEREADSVRDRLIKNQILTKLGAETAFELPRHMLFNETQRQVNDLVYQGYNRGMDDEAIRESEEQIVQEAQARAASNLKTSFILEKIAEAEKIAVTDGEVSNRVVMMAAQAGRPVKKVARQLRDANGFQRIRRELLVGKVLEFLKSNASVTEVDPPAGEDAGGAA
ncbi:MAG: trigger factor [Verrucomicrobiae bacterium]|nr:trigger factor [Verrucomicrobiae bacterium]